MNIDIYLSACFFAAAVALSSRQLLLNNRERPKPWAIVLIPSVVLALVNARLFNDQPTVWAATTLPAIALLIIHAFIYQIFSNSTKPTQITVPLATTITLIALATVVPKFFPDNPDSLESMAALALGITRPEPFLPFLTDLQSLNIPSIIGALALLTTPVNRYIQVLLQSRGLLTTNPNPEEKVLVPKPDTTVAAGELIGIVERWLTFFLVINLQFAALGLIVAAKGLIRSRTETTEGHYAEYVLLGTLLSFGIAVFVGLAYTWLPWVTNIPLKLD